MVKVLISKLKITKGVVLLNVILLIFTIAGCTSRQSQTLSEGIIQEGIPVIDVEKAVASATQYYQLSDIAEQIEYIPLEFKPECAVGSRVFQVYIATEDIFVLTGQSGSNDLFRFDKSGKFLNVIGKQGRGPGEYIDALSFAIDTTKRHIYISTNWTPNIIVYDYEGKYLRTIKKDYTYSGFHFTFLPEANELAHFGTQINLTSPESFFVSITDTDNNRILHKKYLLSSMISSEQRVAGSYTSFLSSNGLLLNDSMSDTLFVYSQSNLNPYLILNYGRYKTTLNAMISYTNDKEALDRCIVAMYIVAETSQYLILLLVQGNGKRFLLRYDKHTQKYETFMVKREEGKPMEIINNDIDGGLPILWRAIPVYNQLARIVDAYDMKEILTAEYFSKSEAKYPQAKERLKNLVQSLKEEDNPVIMKIKLK